MEEPDTSTSGSPESSAPSVSQMELRKQKSPPSIRGSPAASRGVQAARQPRAKRRPPVSQENAGQTQAFFFVDPGSSTREKRAHVMRHHIQEKRKQHKLTSGADLQDGRAGRYLPWRKKQTLEGKEQSVSSPFQLALLPSGPQLASVDTSHQSPSPETVTPGPQDMLSSARRDPFDSFPLRLESSDYQLTDLWTSKLTYWSGQNLHMKNLVFRTAMEHPLTFQAVILCYCARWRAQLYDLGDDPSVKTRLSAVEKVVDESIKGTRWVDEEHLAMALAGLSLHEQRFGQKRRAEQFADQAVQIIRPRTGNCVIAEVLLLYVRYVSMPLETAIDADGARWLVTFLQSAEWIMADQRSDEFLSHVPQRRDVFQFEGSLYPLLSTGPHPTRVPLDHRKYVVRNTPTQEICRTAALIYITTALWDHRDSPSRIARFLDQIVSRVKERGLDRYPACESFMWLLLEESYDPDLKDPERAWSTGELLKMHKILSPELQFHFSELLMSFLMLDKPLRGVDAFEKELRRAVP